MPSTKSHIFIAAATLAVLAGSILGSVSAAPLAGDQHLFGSRHGAVLSDATNQVAKKGFSTIDQHANSIHKAEGTVHIPEGLRNVATMATKPDVARLVRRFQTPHAISQAVHGHTATANALTQVAITHNRAFMNHVSGLNAHDHAHRATLSAHAVQSNMAAHHTHITAAHAHDHAANVHGWGHQHDLHTQRAADHRDVADNHLAAAQAHHHVRRQLAARSRLFDGLERLY